eukprot:CAMPEP_0183749846 /NCGR_PEP_ID=MMETSP0739-20130205/564_1 /TAXON_ID=385413 /ORGANISM="Thalassiosira miniscula, Strain CCMP1093" /LENGTH=127 /DNA_ID=CAMNT_0025985709 /DNA_START=434 /DNA_END=817 /DNA_ORIENTATION=+
MTRPSPPLPPCPGSAKTAHFPTTTKYRLCHCMPSLEMQVRPEKRGAKDDETSQTQGKAAFPTSPTGDPWAGAAVMLLPSGSAFPDLDGDGGAEESPPSSSMAIANLDEMCASEKLTSSSSLLELPDA